MAAAFVCPLAHDGCSSCGIRLGLREADLSAASPHERCLRAARGASGLPKDSGLPKGTPLTESLAFCASFSHHTMNSPKSTSPPRSAST